ncbi:MAG TPA: hypothetical protein VGX23_05240 [Actinocrinis sp.]|nr:hypothetical protein [Actinocrinis sp.]
MDPFPPRHLEWPAGQTRWRVCVLPDRNRDRELFDLIDKARKVFTGFPNALAVVPDAHLNAPVYPLPGSAQDANVGLLTALLATELGARLGAMPVFTLLAGSTSAETESVVLDLNDDQLGEPWDELSGRVGDAVERMFGDEAPGLTLPPPHLTLAYGAGPCDSGLIQSHLRTQARPALAPLTVDAVHLVVVTQHPDAHTYTLSANPIRIPLRTRAA